jgi:hypothetical protein
MAWFFLWVLWLYLLFLIIADVFRSRDLGGWAKAGWIILICFVPYLGVFIYLIARGSSMQDRRFQSRESDFRAYAGEPAGNGSADQLAALAQLRDEGVITEADFQRGKAKVLN